MGVKQDLIPYVGQLVLSNVPVDRWIIGLLDGSCYVTRFPNHNGEFVHPVRMSCGVGMVINGGRNPEMFLKSFPKGPCRLPFVLIITL